MTDLVTLIILDGYGCAPSGPGNAISLANTVNIDAYLARYPHTQITASGLNVGLPNGEMGNSETGHMNVGAGRVVFQKLTLISRMIEDGTFRNAPAFKEAIEHVRRNQSRLHLVGLIGPGGVHAHQEHLKALLKLFEDADIKEIFIQAILDGRDTEPTSAFGYITDLNEALEKRDTGSIASISGRYFAMDRDNRWDRVQKAYDAMVHAKGVRTENPTKAIKKSYAAGITDEYIVPTVVTVGGEPVGCVQDHDAVIFFNFRGDRPRELTKAFVLPDFDAFDRGPKLADLFFVTLAEYEKGLPVVVAFPPERLDDPVIMPLGQVIADAGLRQLRVAETEKYAHVTYFLNGGREEPLAGEDRVMAPSPQVATYDIAPEMNAKGVADAAVQGLSTNDYSLVVVNFANCDMVGHTGNIEATVKAIEQVDSQVARVVEATLAKGGVAIITADHGNAEQMLEPGGGPWTAHSTNPVPFIIIGHAVQGADLRSVGQLGDVSPTILHLLGLTQPASMKGSSLLAGGFATVENQDKVSSHGNESE